MLRSAARRMARCADSRSSSICEGKSCTTPLAIRGDEEWFIGQAGERVLSRAQNRHLEAVFAGVASFRSAGDLGRSRPRPLSVAVSSLVRLDRRRFTDELEHDATYRGWWS